MYAKELLRKSSLKNSEIIQFNTLFTIGDLSLINEYKISMKKDIIINNNTFELTDDVIIYSFKDKINKLLNGIYSKDKIRVWCSYKDYDSYILLVYISTFFKDSRQLYAVFTDETLSSLSLDELENIVCMEKNFGKQEIEKMHHLWNNIVSTPSQLRIIENEKIKLVSFDYYNDLILSILSTLGEIEIGIFIWRYLMKNIYLGDTFLLFLIKRLIILKKISVTNINDNIFKCMIK